MKTSRQTKPGFLLCALLGAGLFCSQAAWADINIVNQVSMRSWQLIDLDPNDGVTPWISFNSYYNQVRSYLDVNTPNNSSANRSLEISGNQADWDATLSYGVHQQKNQYSRQNGGSFKTEIHLANGAQSRFDTTVERNFTLSPHTLLLLKIDLSYQHQNDANQNNYYQNTIVLQGRNPFDQSDAFRVSGFGNADLKRSFKLGLANYNAEIQEGKLYISNYAWANNNYQEIPSVPEAQNWAMSACGLVLSGLLLRRRKSKQ